MNHLRFALALTIGFTVLVFAACGAENAVAPEAEKPDGGVHECRSFDQLMPNFVKAIDEGRMGNLKRLVETQLTVSARPDVPPPINEVLRSIFQTLNSFALLPKEAGAPAGEFCAPTSAQPPLTSANPLCEMRRALDMLVHQGKGIDAINLVTPQLTTLVNYLTGTGTDCKGRPRVPHYEVSAAVSQFCTQNLNCQLTDGLDMTIAFTAYVNTPDGKTLLADLNTLVKKPSVTGLLNPQSLTEADMVTIARSLIVAVQGADPMGLRNAFNALPLPGPVKMDLQPVVGDLEKLLGHPELMAPLRRSLNCLTTEDRNFDAVRMIYRLAIEEQCPEFGLTRLTGAIQGIQDVDQRGSLIFIVGTLAKAVRADELAVDSAAEVCRTVFSTRKAVGGDCTSSAQCSDPIMPDCDRALRQCVALKSNAELALPVVGDLVKSGVVNEGICAIDTLIFGCAGGVQPACR